MYDKMPLWRLGLSKINSAGRIFPTIGWCRTAFCTPPACGPRGVVAWGVLGREISGAKNQFLLALARHFAIQSNITKLTSLRAGVLFEMLVKWVGNVL